MNKDWKPAALRATADEIRTAIMPKTVTPEMVGGTLLCLVNTVDELVGATEQLDDMMNAMTEPVLMGFPYVSENLKKLPFVELAGVIPAEMPPVAMSSMTEGSHYYRQGDGLYYMFEDELHRIVSVNTVFGRPIMSSEAVYLYKNRPYVVDYLGYLRAFGLTSADVAAIEWNSSREGMISLRNGEDTQIAAIYDVARMSELKDTKARVDWVEASLQTLSRQFGHFGCYRVSGAYRASEGGQYRNSGLQELNRNNSLRLTGIRGDAGMAYVSYWDAQGSFVSALALTQATTTGLDRLISPAEFPAKAAYFIISSAYDSSEQAEYSNGLTLERLAENFVNYRRDVEARLAALEASIN